jgi:AraC-like DNA-binding protein
MGSLMLQSNGLVAEYAGTPAGQLYDAWREDICRSFCRIDAEPSNGGEIACKVEIVQVGSLALAAAGGTSGRFLRSRSLLSDSCDDFVLFRAASGNVTVIREGRTVELQQSQMYLSDLAVEGAVGFRDGDQFQTIRIPRRDLLSICPDAENRLATALPADPVLSEVIARYFALSVETAASMDAVGQQLTSRHMIDLIALLLRTGHDETQLASQRGYSEARLQLIQAHVLERLDDSDLTIATVAQSFGLSPKQVQRLFERSGMTFTEFVLEQRLLLAHRLLSRPDGRNNKIGTIAYGAGFGDLSYFNRTYRKRFGMTPSEWRDAQPAAC